MAASVAVVADAPPGKRRRWGEAAVVTAYVGLGANVGDPVRQVRQAMKALNELPSTRVLICSSLYRSAPVGVAEQPDFVNAVCAIETTLAGEALMRHLLDIERASGRRRTVGRGAPRPLDLDLLLYGVEVVTTPELTLPHPRLHERAFVLLPLSEIAPALEIPNRGSVTVLLRDCVDQRVERLKS